MRKEDRMGVSYRTAQIFLDRLNWKANCGGLNELCSFQVDVYQFCMADSLKDDVLKAFTDFLRLLDMRQLRSVMIIFMWLYQRDIKFTLKFRYNQNLPFWYNLKNIRKPRVIRKKMLACGHDDLMSEPVEHLVQYLREKGRITV